MAFPLIQLQAVGWGQSHILTKKKEEHKSKKSKREEKKSRGREKKNMMENFKSMIF